MPRAYFLKEILSNPVFLKDGRKIAFEDFGDDKGGITTEDEGLIAELRASQIKRRGGIIETDQGGFADAKKKASANASRRASQSSSNNVVNPTLLRQKRNGLAPAVANRGAVPDYDAMKVKVPKVPPVEAARIPVGQKLEVPKELPPPPERRPRTRRLSELAVTQEPEKASTISTA